MNHYAVPLYLVESIGGWKNREMIDHYLSFAEFVLSRWGNQGGFLVCHLMKLMPAF